jgi:hypothetical protein
MKEFLIKWRNLVSEVELTNSDEFLRKIGLPIGEISLFSSKFALAKPVILKTEYFGLPGELLYFKPKIGGQKVEVVFSIKEGFACYSNFSEFKLVFGDAKKHMSKTKPKYGLAVTCKFMAAELVFGSDQSNDNDPIAINYVSLR